MNCRVKDSFRNDTVGAPRTKIIATLGTATDKPGVLWRLLQAGTNVVRLNFSHGKAADHVERARQVRALARELALNIAILADLQGPKIRIASFVTGAIELHAGQRFVLDAALARDAGDRYRVGIDDRSLIKDCAVGDTLLLDDGRIQLEIDRVRELSLECTVLVGGPLSNNKGLNRLGGGLSVGTITDKDRKDIIINAAAINPDYIAVSFPRSHEDIRDVRRLARSAGSTAAIIAKVQRAEVVRAPAVLDAIIVAADGVMIARDDLGVEVGDAALVSLQKCITERARGLNRVTITATQMMESMITRPQPTRAEVLDVANAVLECTDAVMLSAESAVGRYPVEAVAAMTRVIRGAEDHPSTSTSKHRLYESCPSVSDSIALTAMYAANHLKGVKALVCLTATGVTPRVMSRIRSSLPIVALTADPAVQRRMALYRGVQALQFDADIYPSDQVNYVVVNMLVEMGILSHGDRIIITKGDYLDVQGGTNTLKIIQVGNEIR